MWPSVFSGHTSRGGRSVLAEGVARLVGGGVGPRARLGDAVQSFAFAGVSFGRQFCARGVVAVLARGTVCVGRLARWAVSVAVVGRVGRPLTWRVWLVVDLAHLVVAPCRLVGRRGRRFLSPEHVGTVEHGLAADAGLAGLRLGLRRGRVADLRAVRRGILLGDRGVFLLGRLFPFLDRTYQVVGDFLRVGCGLVHLLRIFFEGFEPSLDVRRASASVMADADTLARHHRGHFGAEFFAGVLGAAEIADAVFQRVAVHARRVAGGVAEFVEGGLVVPVRCGELFPLGQRHLVGLDVVAGAVAANVRDVYADGTLSPLRAPRRPPSEVPSSHRANASPRVARWPSSTKAPCSPK